MPNEACATQVVVGPQIWPELITTRVTSVYTLPLECMGFDLKYIHVSVHKPGGGSTDLAATLT